MKIKIHFVDKEPEDYKPFSITPGQIWKLYDEGKLNPEKGWLLNILYRKANPYEGIGRTSHAELCVEMKISPTQTHINHITKIMRELKELGLIWFSKHSGVRDFQYILDKFKLAKIQGNNPEKWTDITSYLPSKEQNESRGNYGASAEPPPETAQRGNSPEQRLEMPKNGSISHIREDIKKRFSRGFQTDTDTDTNI